MPPQLTYPGVYIEELSSGVHTITGVATSIAAFVGWAPWGPVEEATLVQSWPDFETLFGGLHSDSRLGYSVNQFFANGGQQAYIVRLIWDGTVTAAPGTSPKRAGTARSTGIGLATTVITAESGNTKDSTNLMVGSVFLEGIALSPATLPFLQIGQTLQLTATGTNSDRTRPNVTSSVTWTSGSPGIVTVSSGLLTAMAAGRAVITATQGAVTSSIEVTVSTEVLTTIAVTPSAPSIAAGQTLPFTAKGNYSKGSQDLTAFVAWKSSDPTEATIDPTGLAKGVAAGTPSITATLAGVTGSATLTVSNATLVSIEVTPANPAWLQPSGTLQYRATGIFTDGPPQDLTATVTWKSANSIVATISTAAWPRPSPQGPRSLPRPPVR